MRTMQASLTHTRRAGLFGLCLLAAPLALAQTRPPQALAPGEYVSAGGRGVLTLRTEVGNRVLFELEAVGGNGHTCSLDGEIRGGRTIVSDTPDPQACVVRFETRGAGIDISTNDADSCRSFCGARASFTGRYLRQPPGCDSLSRGAAGAEFKQRYDNRDYLGAQQQAGRLLDRCASTMDRIERGRWLNDLAITQYQLGLHDQCLRTLQPVAADAALSNDSLQSSMAPADYDNYLPIVESTRTNLRLCKGSKGQQ